MSDADFRALIPHQGTMCLLERVVSWDDRRIVLGTLTHQSSQNPLLREGQLSAVHLCEYGAQAMAVHGALLAHAQGTTAPPGMLVSVRDVKLDVDDVRQCHDELIVDAECLHAAVGSMQYRFVITHQSREIASGRAAVITRPE